MYWKISVSEITENLNRDGMKNENQVIESDEISLFDLFNVLLRYKRLLIGLPIFGAVSAALLASSYFRQLTR